MDLENETTVPSRRLRVVVAVSHPIQHFCPLYRALSQDNRASITVLFESLKGAEPYWDPSFDQVIQWGTGITSGFEWQTLGRKDDRNGSSLSRRFAAIGSLLRKIKPDVVVVYSYTQVISVATAIYARLMGCPVVAITDSALLSHRSFARRLAKTIVVRLWLRLVDVLLTCGDENERYYEHYGFPREQMVRCPFPIDEESFQAIAPARSDCRRAIRDRLGIPEGAFVALTVGKLIPLKGHRDLVRAVAAASTGNPAVGPYLLLAGDGPDRTALESLANELGLREAVFAGFVNPSELPLYYAASDVYVHPSLADAHPLAITEAMYSSLPLIASDRVGSVGDTDDLQPGRNGWVVPAEDCSFLAQLLRELVSQPQLLKDASLWSAQIWRGRTMRASVQGFLRGVYLAAGLRAPEPVGRIPSSSNLPTSRAI
jgi:glycosyltransferase involved in cell wall biosynthesis